MNHLGTVITFIFAAGTAMAADNAPGTAPTTSPTKYESNAMAGTTEGFKSDVAMFRQEMVLKLESAESEIMALKEKAKIKGSKIKQTTITDLEKTKEKIRMDVDALDKSTESNWKSMKSKIAGAMDNLNTRTQKLLRE